MFPPVRALLGWHRRTPVNVSSVQLVITAAFMVSEPLKLTFDSHPSAPIPSGIASRDGVEGRGLIALSD